MCVCLYTYYEKEGFLLKLLKLLLNFYTSKMLKKLILKFIKPDPKSVIDVHDAKGIQLLTRLGLG